MSLKKAMRILAILRVLTMGILTAAAGAAESIVYLTLVNKMNPLPAGWEIMSWGC